MQVIVGRIGRPHGIRGEVGVEVRTDEPDRRFAVGARVLTDTVPARTLTVTSARWHGGRLLVGLAGVPDRTAAEALRNVVVLSEVDDEEKPADPDEFYDRDLVGLTVRDETGAEVGSVATVVHLPAQDLLEVARADGRTALVPLVADLVPTVDVAGGFLVVADRPGLLDPDAADAADSGRAPR
jgi:16S rRNA processing protein RimM